VTLLEDRRGAALLDSLENIHLDVYLWMNDA